MISAKRLRSTSTSPLRGVDTSLVTAVGGVLDTTNTNAGIIPLNLIAPGFGSWQRYGRMALNKSVRIRMVLRHALGDVGDTWTSGIIRIALVWDKQPSGTVPTFDQIFGITNSNGVESSSIDSPLRYDNTGRFVVIRDSFHHTPNAQNGTSNSDTLSADIMYDEYVELRALETNYSGESTPPVIGDISSGALYLIARANTNYTKAQWSIPQGFARLRFTC